MKVYRVILLSILAAVAFNTANAKKVKLRYNLIAGQEFVIEHSNKQEIGQEVMGQNQVMENTILTEYSFRVLEVKGDGSYILEQKISAAEMQMENDFININYNSREDETVPEGLEYLANTIDVPISFLMSNTGEILEVVDAQDYLKTIEEALAGVEGMMQQLGSGMASQTASIQGIKLQISTLFLKYPAEKIKVGHTWEDVTESRQMVAFTNKLQNTLVEANKETATIKQDVNIEMMELEEALEMEGMEINYELNGRKEAAYTVDLATGLISKVQGVTDISGVVSIDSPQLPSPMNMPMTLKTTEELKIKR